MKRTAWKITANSISKVRSNYPAGGASEGSSFDEYASSGSAAGPAPWDLPAEPAGTSAGRQSWQAQQGQEVLTTEQKWMDFFEDSSSESCLLLRGCGCADAATTAAAAAPPASSALLPRRRCSCAAVACRCAAVVCLCAAVSLLGFLECCCNAASAKL